jgi:hypothetical protein
LVLNFYEEIFLQFLNNPLFLPARLVWAAGKFFNYSRWAGLPATSLPWKSAKNKKAKADYAVLHATSFTLFT